MPTTKVPTVSAGWEIAEVECDCPVPCGWVHYEAVRIEGYDADD